jgi:hypothetical protein
MESEYVIECDLEPISGEVLVNVSFRKVEYHGATMTFEIDQGAYRLLLQLVLAQRLEINAIESALKNAGALADSQIQEIRLQSAKAAEVWSRDAGIDLLGLIRVHSSPNAKMLMPLSPEATDELRREIDGQTPESPD